MSVVALAPTPAFDFTETPRLLQEVGERWMAAMQEGDYEAAWRQTDRIELPRRAAQKVTGWFRQPYHLLWDGTPFAGREVLVRCEHGLGDSLQYLRYCAELRKLAHRVTVRVQPALLEVLQGMEGIDHLVDAWTVDPDPPHEVAIECMELAYAFRSQAADLPNTAPYLAVERLRGRMPIALQQPSNRRRIGLIWAASAWNPRRSIPLSTLVPLGTMEGVEYYSLQQGPERVDVSAGALPMVDLSPQTSQVEDAAAAMLAMDLVITVDSMTAHLAGALGRPVWLLLTHQPDWRWQHRGSGSPWYPTMKIFRQERDGSWDDVIQELLRNLRSVPPDVSV